MITDDKIIEIAKSISQGFIRWKGCGWETGILGQEAIKFAKKIAAAQQERDALIGEQFSWEVAARIRETTMTAWEDRFDEVSDDPFQGVVAELEDESEGKVSPQTIAFAVRCIRQLWRECEEQSRLLGMSGSREAALLAKLETAERDAIIGRYFMSKMDICSSGWVSDAIFIPQNDDCSLKDAAYRAAIDTAATRDVK